MEANGATTVVFTYRVKNAETVAAEGMPKRAHLFGPFTYMYVVGQKHQPVLLTVRAPAGFKIATSLDPQSPVTPGSGTDATEAVGFWAPNYDVLADAPIEMGNYAEDNFQVRGVLYGKYETVDRAKLLDYCRRVAEIEIGFFHDAPFKRYVFMFRSAGANQGGGGGLEHLGSTEIGIRGLVEDRVRFVIAHEYFHAWNVKRIRPFVLGPFNYIDPPHTANLWWSEGVTSYYADLLSRRGGINTEAEYLKHLESTIGQLQNNPARLKVTADETSRRVFDTGNSQGYGSLSYYTKGELIGLCLDLKIRQVTGGRRSLDDVMQALYLQCGKGLGPGFGEDDILKRVNRVAGQDLSGAALNLLVERNGERLNVAYTVGSRSRVAWTVTPDPAATPGQLRLRAGWMGDRAPSSARVLGRR